MLKSKRDFKATKVGSIPSNWEVKEVKELFELFAGGDLSKLSYSKNKTQKFKYPIYSNSLKNRGLHGFSDNYQFESGCITVTARGDVGRAEYRSEPFNAIVRLLVLKPKQNISGYYIANYINTKMKFEHVGAAQNQLTIPSIEHRLLALPESFEEQQKISSILLIYDTLIENNSRRIELLESMAKLIYDEWFVKFKFPGHESVKMVDSELGQIPEGWEVKKLSDIVYNVKDSIMAENLPNEMKYLPIDLIPRKSMLLQEVAPIEDAQSSLTLFKKGDIVFGAMRAYFHKVILAPFDGVTRKTCFTLRARTKELWSFSYLTIFKESTIEYASLHSNGSTIPYAVWDNGLGDMKLVVPPKDILEAFEHKISPLLKHIVLTFFKQQNLSKTRDLLLPRLISGEIDVSEPELIASEVVA